MSASGEEGVVRIGSGQGFWGDDEEAPMRQVEGGPLDFLVMDYLAEVTMSIMQKQRERDPAAGYALDFPRVLRRLLPKCVRPGSDGNTVRIVTNAGGVNPRACGEAAMGAARAEGLADALKIGVVTGDDLLNRLDDLLQEGHEFRHMEDGRPLEDVRDRVTSANAYIGAEPLVRALAAGANVVIAGRATDTALTYAPMMHAFGWAGGDLDRVAQGVVAGHLNECGAQASGGNVLADWWSIPGLERIGYPIIEASSDGSFVVTKHEGTGGRIDRASVTEQLLYELGDPANYLTPDVVADLTDVELEEVGENRIRVTGARGRPRTDSLKVSIAYRDGYRAEGTLVYAWPDAARKAQAAERILRQRLDLLGLRFDEVRAELVGWDATHGHLAGPPPPDLPEVQLRVAVRGQRREDVDRFTREIAPLVLAGPPSVTGFAGGRPRTREVMAFWPALVPRQVVESQLKVEVLDATDR
ncbi:MAG: acyclic terpene utilization AtuA family protein [Gemmatimonadota bacterium]